MSLKPERGNYKSQDDWRKRHNARFELKVYRATEADILDKLESVDNVTDYIRKLIREDIARGEKKGDKERMNKTIWIAREADDNSDAYKAFFDREKAETAALGYYEHLIDRERKKRTVTVEGYPVEVADDDTRTAEELCRDLLMDDELAMFDPEVYEEIRRYEVEFSGGQERYGERAVNYMLVKIDGTELYAEELVPEDMSEDDMPTFDDASYARLKNEILRQADEKRIPASWLKFYWD